MNATTPLEPLATSPADPATVIRCAVYQGGRKMADIPSHDIHLHVNRPDCLLWVAVVDPDPGILEQLQHEFSLHPLAVEDARHGHQRPKIEEYADSLFVVMHMLEQQDGVLNVGEVNVFVGPNYVLTVRNRARIGFQDVRGRCEREPELLRKGAAYVLYALMDAVVDRYFPVLEKIEDELETIEENIFANVAVRANLESLYALKQKLTVVKHAVAPLTEVLSNLSGQRVPRVCSGMQEYFRDIYDHLLRLNQAIESARETILTAISVNLSIITLQENETMKRLAAYAGLIAVPTLIAGIYGMNFQHMPELTWQYGYGMAVGSMVLIDAYLFYRLRKAKWL
jgi:magnesium transporter